MIASFVSTIEAKKADIEGCIARSRELYEKLTDALDIAKDDERAKSTSELFKYYSNFLNAITKQKTELDKEREKTFKKVTKKPLKLGFD